MYKLKGAYPDRALEKTVREYDETDYLLKDAALCSSVENAKRGSNLVTFETLADAIQYAESPAP